MVVGWGGGGGFQLEDNGHCVCSHHDVVVVRQEGGHRHKDPRPGGAGEYVQPLPVLHKHDVGGQEVVQRLEVALPRVQVPPEQLLCPCAEGNLNFCYPRIIKRRVTYCRRRYVRKRQGA